MTPTEIIAAWDECALPGMVYNIERVLGSREKAAMLISKFSGATFNVPIRNDSNTKYWCKVIAAIGEESAALLVKEYSGDKLYIPMCKSLSRYQMVKEYENGVLAGKSNDEICFEICAQRGVSARTVERTVNKPTFEKRP